MFLGAVSASDLILYFSF